MFALKMQKYICLFYSRNVDYHLSQRWKYWLTSQGLCKPWNPNSTAGMKNKPCNAFLYATQTIGQLLLLLSLWTAPYGRKTLTSLDQELRLGLLIEYTCLLLQQTKPRYFKKISQSRLLKPLNDKVDENYRAT